MNKGLVFVIRSISFLIILVGVSRSSESQNVEYNLHNLSVEAYIAGVDSVTSQFTDYYFDALVAISQEFELRYGDHNLTDINLDSLISFQTTIGIGHARFIITDEREWFQAILEVGLRDIDLSTVSDLLTVGNFEINVSPVDFDGNGQEEYLLDVYDGFSGRRFYALASEEIQLLPLPIVGLLGDAVTWGSPTSGVLGILRNEDIDGDGGTELIFQGADYGYWSSCGDLYIIDWELDRLVVRGGGFRGLFHYCIPYAQSELESVEFSTDDPEAIQMVNIQVDGWNCKTITTASLDLLSNTSQEIITSEDTIWCELRDAAIAYDEQDYLDAAELYSSVLPDVEEQLAQYISARIALAHALAGQLNKAVSTLNDVTPEGQMGKLITDLLENSENVESMCQAAHDFFQQTNIRDDAHTNPYEWTAENFYFGNDLVDPRYYPLPIPSQAGCDYEEVLNLTPTAIPSVSTSQPDIHRFVRNSIYTNLREGHYEETLAQIDDFLASGVDASSPNYLAHLLYWRAITLELTGRETEALEQYISLYQAYPDSGWGQLAKLHFEEK